MILVDARTALVKPPWLNVALFVTLSDHQCLQLDLVPPHSTLEEQTVAGQWQVE